MADAADVLAWMVAIGAVIMAAGTITGQMLAVAFGALFASYAVFGGVVLYAS